MPHGGVMTRPGNAPKQPPKSNTGRRSLLLITVFIAVLVSGWAGWLIRGGPASRAVRVSSTFTGTVTLVGNGGSSGCIKPDGDGKAICSGFFVEAGTPPLKVGQRVHAAEEWAKNTSGGSANLLLVYTPST